MVDSIVARYVANSTKGILRGQDGARLITVRCVKQTVLVSGREEGCSAKDSHQNSPNDNLNDDIVLMDGCQQLGVVMYMDSC